MKKVLCLILSIVLLVSVPLSVTASDISSDSKIAVDSAKYCLATEFPSIIKSKNNEYAMVYDDGETYIPTGRVDICLSNDNQVDSFLSTEGVSKEVKEYILNTSEKIANDPNNQDLIATIFSPDLLPKTRATQYYTYKNMEMKSELVYLYNISTPYCLNVSGTGAKNAAKAISSIIIAIGGYYSTAISLGGTLLSIFEAAASGTVQYATAQDFSQMLIKYDDVKQWTYGMRYDGWYLGCVTEKVTIKQVTQYQQFVINNIGTQETTHQYPNAVRKSTHYDSPWATAYANLYNPVTEYVTYSVNGSTWYF